MGYLFYTLDGKVIRVGYFFSPSCATDPIETDPPDVLKRFSHPFPPFNSFCVFLCVLPIAKKSDPPPFFFNGSCYSCCSQWYLPKPTICPSASNFLEISSISHFNFKFDVSCYSLHLRLTPFLLRSDFMYLFWYFIR